MNAARESEFAGAVETILAAVRARRFRAADALLRDAADRYADLASQGVDAPPRLSFGLPPPWGSAPKLDPTWAVVVGSKAPHASGSLWVVRVVDETGSVILPGAHDGPVFHATSRGVARRFENVVGRRVHETRREARAAKMHHARLLGLRRTRTGDVFGDD